MTSDPLARTVILEHAVRGLQADLATYLAHPAFAAANTRLLYVTGADEEGVTVALARGDEPAGVEDLFFGDDRRIEVRGLWADMGHPSWLPGAIAARHGRDVLLAYLPRG